MVPPLESTAGPTANQHVLGRSKSLKNPGHLTNADELEVVPPLSHGSHHRRESRLVAHRLGLDGRALAPPSRWVFVLCLEGGSHEIMGYFEIQQCRLTYSMCSEERCNCVNLRCTTSLRRRAHSRSRVS